MFHRQWVATVCGALKLHRFPVGIGDIIAEYSSMLSLDEMKCALAADNGKTHGEVRPFLLQML
jgi:hypothetical protein